MIKSLLLVVFFLPLFLYSGKLNRSQSILPTNIKDQLSSAQLSYFARLGAGNTLNNTNIIINTDSGTAPSNNTNNIFVGDTLAIGNSAVGFTGSVAYVVKDVPSSNTISLSAGIGASNIFTGAYAVATRSASHTVSFTPQSNVAGGKWQVLIKTTNTTGETYNDGMPDQGGFDAGLGVAVTCPWSATASVGSTTISTNAYILVTCALGAGITNPINVGASIVIGTGTSMLINPAPASSHIGGTGDIYTFYVRHTDASGAVIDSDTGQGKIAMIESVRVTATVDPTITFSIGTSGVSSGTRCGYALSSAASSTTATSVAFGSLTLGASTGNNLAQFLQCTTNASNGYVIQAFETGQLTMIGGSTTFPDTTCDSGSCSASSANTWSSSTTSGFGYSLEVGTTGPGGSPTLGIGATNLAKPFGVGYANAQNIFSRTNTPSGTDSFYVCYRIAVSNYQPAGTYQNQINYIATATF